MWIKVFVSFIKLASPAFQQVLPHKVFGKLTIQMFEVINKSIDMQESLEIGDVLKRLTLNALTLAGFGMEPDSILLSILTVSNRVWYQCIKWPK